MNYFSHGHRYTDRPYFMVGTAVPDMLSAVDRQVRVRTKETRPFADGSATPQAELAAGILQHLHDDAWFHVTPAFYSTTGQLTALFRELLVDDDSPRASFLGHIVTELLLDAVLIERDPGVLEAYYTAFSQIDAVVVEATVNAIARRPTERLAPLIPLFLQERFLGDYVEPQTLLIRLNQVLRRVKLQPLPPETTTLLAVAREIVEASAPQLLSPPPGSLS